jgi:hypothetical protein
MSVNEKNCHVTSITHCHVKYQVIGCHATHSFIYFDKNNIMEEKSEMSKVGNGF